jgi:hypothetical protein
LNSQDVFVLDENTMDVPGRRITLRHWRLGWRPWIKYPVGVAGLELPKSRPKAERAAKLPAPAPDRYG